MVATFDVASPVRSIPFRRQHASSRKRHAFDGDFDGPNRALIGIDGRASANLFDKPPHQPETMPFVFGFSPETRYRRR